MSDREYVKINTSIQTGSNAQNLIEDTEGNVQAEIELRLPDNLFSATNGAKKVDKVELLTTKMRVSMQNTPIAQIPIDTELQTTTYTPSTCQLDVYPFCLIDDGEFYPKTLADTAFPNYKTKIRIDLLYVSENNNPATSPFVLQLDEYDLPVDAKRPSEVINVNSGEPPSETVGKSIIAIAQKCLASSKDVQSFLMSRMNMCLPNNHETLTIENGELLIKHISSLAQLWNDALENAMVTALRETNQTITFLVTITNADFLDAADEVTAQWYKTVLNLDTTNTVLLPSQPLLETEAETTRFYVGTDYIDNLYQTTTMIPLRTAFKPEVSFDDNSLTVAYDTAPFYKNTPILWNPALVDTGNSAEQLKENPFLSAYTLEPPAKRYYVTPVEQTGETAVKGIDANLIFSDSTSKVFNIIGNRATRDTFSFLPWTEIPRTIAPIAPHLSLAEGEPFYLLNVGGTKTERSARDLYKEGTGEERIITERARVQQRVRYIYPNITSAANSGFTVNTISYQADGFYQTTMFSQLVRMGAITESQMNQFRHLYRGKSYANYIAGGGSWTGYIFKVNSLNVNGDSFNLADAKSIAWTNLYQDGRVINGHYTDVVVLNSQSTSTLFLKYAYETTPSFEFVSETYEAGSGAIQYPNTSFEENIISQGEQSYVEVSQGRNGVYANPVSADNGAMWTNSRTFDSYNWGGGEQPQSTDFQWYECTRLASSFDNVNVIYMPAFVLNNGVINLNSFNAWLSITSEEPDPVDGSFQDIILCIQVIGKQRPGTAFGGNDTYLMGKNNSQDELNSLTAIMDIGGSHVYRASLAVDQVNEIDLTRRRSSGYFNGVNQSVKVTTTWGNLPTVVMSPIQSFVLTLQGVQVRQEYQPINRVEGNASSLTSSFPVIENYYTLASSLADLHDELVIIKDSFNDQPLYSLPTTAGESRVLKFTLYFITKDGRLHKLFIPKKGIFALQLTFGITYYYTS